MAATPAQYELVRRAFRATRDAAPRGRFENPAAVQFHHRTLALLTLGIALWYAWRRRATTSDVAARRAWGFVQLAGVVQVSLGVATLLLHVPIPLAALHQAGALGLLTATLYAGARDGVGRSGRAGA